MGRHFATQSSISGATPSATFGSPTFRWASFVRDAVRDRLTEIGVNSAVHYQRHRVRAALRPSPSQFDVNYTRTLGFGAVRYLLDGGSGALIALSRRARDAAQTWGISSTPKPGASVPDQVNLTTEAYRVARDYMVYLDPSDFSDDRKLAALAAQTIHRARSLPRTVRVRSSPLGSQSYARAR